MSDPGTLEARESANFILLDADPPDDIANTRRISAFYPRGSAIDAAPCACWRQASPAGTAVVRERALTLRRNAGADYAPTSGADRRSWSAGIFRKEQPVRVNQERDTR